MSTTEGRTGVSPTDPLAYVDAAAALTMVGGAAYIVGYNYVDAYYDQVGFGSASITLPTAAYLRQAILPLLIPALLIVAASAHPSEGKSSRARVALQNLAFLILIAIPPLCLGTVKPTALPLLVTYALIFRRDRNNYDLLLCPQRICR